MRHSRSTVPQSALGRWLVSLLSTLALGLLAAGHVLPVLHFALVAHELCAEHGALHHVEQPSKPGLERARSARPEATNASANAGHEHDDCNIVATATSRAVLSERAELAKLPPAVTPSRLSLRARATERSVALLDYAPKLAPPV